MTPMPELFIPQPGDHVRITARREGSFVSVPKSKPDFAARMVGVTGIVEGAAPEFTTRKWLALHLRGADGVYMGVHVELVEPEAA